MWEFLSTDGVVPCLIELNELFSGGLVSRHFEDILFHPAVWLLLLSVLDLDLAYLARYDSSVQPPKCPLIGRVRKLQVALYIMCAL